MDKCYIFVIPPFLATQGSDLIFRNVHGRGVVVPVP